VKKKIRIHVRAGSPSEIMDVALLLREGVEGGCLTPGTLTLSGVARITDINAFRELVKRTGFPQRTTRATSAITTIL